MKMCEVETSNQNDCPVKDVCNSKHCGDPDYCIFANLSTVELDMDVEDYLNLKFEYNQKIKNIENEKMEKLKIKKEKAKRTSEIRKAVQNDPQVKASNRIKDDIQARLNFIEKVNTLSNAFSLTATFMGCDNSENGKYERILTKTEIEMEKLKKDYNEACENVKTLRKLAFKRLRKNKNEND